MSDLARNFHFAKYVPPARILRRLSAMTRHRLTDRLGIRAVPLPDVVLCEALPEPIFNPRDVDVLRYNGETLHMEFLGRQARFAGTLPDWDHRELQLWRMMLHYMEWLEPLDAEEFARFTCDWIERSGTPRPGAWRDSWNAYAVSIRVVVWLQQLAKHRNLLPPETSELIGRSAAGQLVWLETHLETDIGGNHLIKNIKALLWGSACFEGEAAIRWRVKSSRLLVAELKRQILPDGVHYERSPAYHDQVLADLLECRAVLRDAVPELDAAIVRMAQVAVDLAHPDGRVAQFNDAGLSMAYPPGEILDAMKRLELVCPVRQVCFSYRVAGYFGLHSSAMSLIADCGPIAPDDLPAHGHGDILSFELSRGTQRVIVDPGVYEYVAGSRRQAARSAASHNTLWVEGVDQAEFFDAFRMGRRPRTIRANWRQSDDGIVLEGHHDGYRDLPGHPVHHRRIITHGNVVEIEDHLETERAISARVGFLLHPAITVTRAAPDALKLSWPQGALVMQCAAELKCEPAVWWPDMGVERQTNRITIMLEDARRTLRCTMTLVGG